MILRISEVVLRRTVFGAYYEGGKSTRVVETTTRGSGKVTLYVWPLGPDPELFTVVVEHTSRQGEPRDIARADVRRAQTVAAVLELFQPLLAAAGVRVEVLS